MFTLCKTLIPGKIGKRKEWSGGLRTYVAVSDWSTGNCELFMRPNSDDRCILFNAGTVFYNNITYNWELLYKNPDFWPHLPYLKSDNSGLELFISTINWNRALRFERAYLRFSMTPPTQPRWHYLPGLTALLVRKRKQEPSGRRTAAGPGLSVNRPQTREARRETRCDQVGDRVAGTPASNFHSDSFNYQNFFFFFNFVHEQALSY